LRTILLDKANYYLSSQQLNKYKIFNSDSVIKIWDNHKNNIENNGCKLWNIIILQQWLEYNEII
jgi:hypothetical protein